jgi:hypothetical protein
MPVLSTQCYTHAATKHYHSSMVQPAGSSKVQAKLSNQHLKRATVAGPVTHLDATPSAFLLRNLQEQAARAPQCPLLMIE